MDNLPFEIKGDTIIGMISHPIHRFPPHSKEGDDTGLRDTASEGMLLSIP